VAHGAGNEAFPDSDRGGGRAVPPAELERFSAAQWLAGFVLTESSGRPDAKRYEPHQDRARRRDAAADPDTPDRDDGQLEDDASHGLKQVIGYNGRRPMLRSATANCSRLAARPSSASFP
jgi:hypothetical protein